mmetsp:Transcript_11589/g.20452  ORF Transcript_11589/g.20452 Transcript_11589/m.20452 type:complete len:250 (+) Transcript_11589:381-1130(+)
MISTVSPGASATDHTLNTLRYADRIKEQRVTSSSSNRKSMRSATKNAVPAKIQLSQERLARIFAALESSQDHSNSSKEAGVQKLLSARNKQLSPTGLVENTEDPDYPESVSTLSGEMSDLEDIFEDGPEAIVSTNEGSNKQRKPTEEEEAEMRRTVQALFELEEALLNQHMSNIQENADMLTQEGRLLQTVQGNDITDEDMDKYAITLAEFLDRKETLIQTLQSKLDDFKSHLAKEQRLAQKVTRLTQY